MALSRTFLFLSKQPPTALPTPNNCILAHGFAWLRTYMKNMFNSRIRKPIIPYTAAELDRIKAKETLSPREAAAVAGISNSSLYGLWQRGAGPQSFKIGRSRRVRRTDLDRWITSLGASK